VAYDVAAVLLSGHQVPNSTYEAAVGSFGEQGVAEIAYLVACYASSARCSTCSTSTFPAPS
jgi:4-carboxymuconolactone decarboxylase